MKTIIALFTVLVLVCVCVYYVHRDSSNNLGNGAYTVRDGGTTDKSNDNPAMNDSRAATTDSSSTQVVPAAQATNQPFNQNAQASTTVATPTGTITSLPNDNTEAANAPDLARFSGAGRYQWYRQGDLTWRIDTVSGAMCVAFATKPEWRDPDVIRHGCGNA